MKAPSDPMAMPARAMINPAQNQFQNVRGMPRAMRTDVVSLLADRIRNDARIPIDDSNNASPAKTPNALPGNDA
jgi:hypothetical protein